MLTRHTASNGTPTANTDALAALIKGEIPAAKKRRIAAINKELSALKKELSKVLGAPNYEKAA
jgi:hypothetical protein